MTSATAELGDSAPAGRGPLRIGQNFGTRYHIIRLLGVGGMGAVYQAWDQVLEVAVALKVIRTENAPDAASADRLTRRFKHELLLARQVTHRNVVRIHDLGEIDGVMYISMPYIQGSDLATILKREGRLPVDRAISIAIQIGSGLAAAHAAGVVHRDLKPANIMIEPDGSVVVMDFGIARSTSDAVGFSMTASGVIVGTVEYMAPEQARGASVDGRVDIYALGLILNDSLLGRRQGSATGVGELMARMQQAPAPLRSIDATIPEAVDAIVARCLQPDPAARYQQIGELVTDLNALDPSGRVAGPGLLGRVRLRRPGSPAAWRWAAAAILAVAVVGTGWLERARWLPASPAQPRAAAPPTSGRMIALAILPFRNASGDVTLDSLGSSLSEVLRTELGQSAQLRTIPSDRLLQVLKDLRIAPNATLAPTELARVADFTNARTVLWGQLSRFGNAIRIDATLQDLDKQQTVPLNAMASNEGALLTAMSQLAEAVRQNLARESPNILGELKATAWKPSTGSFEALRQYDDAVELTRQGKHQEALKSFEASTKSDPNFALAFSGLAQSYATLGYDTEAGQFSRHAMELADALPAQEKYRIAANHYRIVNDSAKAIEAYENLAKAAPNDTMIQFDLGGLYEQTGALDQAAVSFGKVVAADAKFVQGLLALGRVEIKRGNPDRALEPLDRALSLAIQVDNDEARANILQAVGIAYMRLNRPTEALRRYQESLEIKQRLGDKRGMAASYVQMAEVQQALGTPRNAEESYREALKLRRAIGDKSGLSLTLMDLAGLMNDTFGKSGDALSLLQEALTILRDTGNQNLEARALNNIGNVYLSEGQYSEAQTYFERALELRATVKAPQEKADVLHNLGETLLKMGRYDQSLSRYLAALEIRRASGDKRNAAFELYGIGTIFDYQGRYGAAVKSKEEALRTFVDLKQRNVWLGEMMSGYGNSLGLSGRTADAESQLDQALALANELQNPNLIAETLRLQAERLFYAGDVKGASRLSEQAAQAATRAPDRTLGLLAQADVAILESVVRPTKASADRLARLAGDADIRGLKAVSVQCLVQQAETLFKVGARGDARREIDRALARADELGLRVLQARARYLRASMGPDGSGTDARREYAAALRVFEELKAEDGNQKVLERADLATAYAECRRGSTAGSTASNETTPR